MVKETEHPEFWSDSDRAQEHMQKLSAARDLLEPWEELHQKLEDTVTLAELAVEEDDESVAAEIQSGLQEAQESFEKLELSAMLSGQYDQSNAILTITAGAGGTEACDWAEMLLRMYRF